MAAAAIQQTWSAEASIRKRKKKMSCSLRLTDVDNARKRRAVQVFISHFHSSLWSSSWTSWSLWCNLLFLLLKLVTHYSSVAAAAAAAASGRRRPSSVQIKFHSSGTESRHLSRMCVVCRALQAIQSTAAAALASFA